MACNRYLFFFFFQTCEEVSQAHTARPSTEADLSCDFSERHAARIRLRFDPREMTFPQLSKTTKSESKYYIHHLYR